MTAPYRPQWRGEWVVAGPFDSFQAARAWVLGELPGDRPDEVGPSGTYGWRLVDPIPGVEKGGAVLQVVEATNGRQWIATPARYYVEDVARWGERAGGLAIDQGMGWYLPREDYEPLIAYARRILTDLPF